MSLREKTISSHNTCETDEIMVEDSLSKPEMVEVSSQKLPGVNEPMLLRELRTTLRLTRLLTKCRIDGEHVASHNKNSRVFGVRRACESHAILVTNFVGDTDNKGLFAPLDICRAHDNLTIGGALQSDACINRADGVVLSTNRGSCAFFLPPADGEQVNCTLPSCGTGEDILFPAQSSSSVSRTGAGSVVAEGLQRSGEQSGGAGGDANQVVTPFCYDCGVDMSCLRNIIGNSGSLFALNSLKKGLSASSNVATKQLLRMSKRGVFGLFSIIERGYFKAFVDIFRRYQLLLEPFLEAVLKPSQSSYTNAIDVMGLLRGGGEALDDNFFSDPLVVWPTHVLYTVSCFYVTAKLHGYEKVFNVISLRGGLFASGKSLFAALAVAMSSTEEELVRRTAQMHRAAFFAGLVYSQHEKYFQTHVAASFHRSFALLLVNISLTVLQLLLNRVNRLDGGEAKDFAGPFAKGASYVIPMSRLEVTRIISSRSFVVSGHPLDLQRLNILLVRYVNKTGIRVHSEYLPIMAPEHSSFYNQLQYFELLQMWRDNEVELDASALQLILYSPVDGLPWKGERTGLLVEKVALAVMCVPHDLTCSLRHLRSGDVLLDFSAATLCVSKLIAWTQTCITVLLEPFDHPSASVYFSPRRGTADLVVRSTLARCAQINNILHCMHWDGKPACAYVSNLAMTFLELGLLTRAKGCAVGGDTSSSFNASQMTASFSSNDVGCFFDSFTARPPVNRESTSAKLNADCNIAACSCLGHPFLLPAANESLFDATGSLRCVFLLSDKRRGAINLYEASRVAEYYETRFNLLLTEGAVEFAWRLSQSTGIMFPPYILLECSTILTLIELWETYEFLKDKTSATIWLLD